MTAIYCAIRHTTPACARSDCIFTAAAAAAVAAVAAAAAAAAAMIVKHKHGRHFDSGEWSMVKHSERFK